MVEGAQAAAKTSGIVMAPVLAPSVTRRSAPRDTSPSLRWRNDQCTVMALRKAIGSAIWGIGSQLEPTPRMVTVP